MTWPVVALGEVAEVVRGVTFSKADAFSEPGLGRVPVLRAGNISDRLELNDDLAFVDKSFISAAQLLKHNDIVMCMSSGSASVLGKSAIVEQDWVGSFGAFLATIRSSPSSTCPRYLAHVFKAPVFRAWASASSGIGIKNIRASDLKAYSIPLPPLEEQKRIAAILDQADALRRLHRRALDRLNTLGQAIFHEMFGDPGSNPKGWPLRPLGELGILERGVSKHRPRNDPALLDGAHPLIQTGDVSRAGDYITSHSSTYSELGLKQSRKWRSGTLCITIAANIADTAILGFDSCFPDSVVGFDSGNQAHNFFVHRWFATVKGHLDAIAPAVAQKNINLAILRELPVISPNASLVDAFFEKERVSADAIVLAHYGLRHSEKLFNSLQHRAFRGEL